MNVFLVTSTIFFPDKPLSYTSVRSVYSPRDRLAQLLLTVDSIRFQDIGSQIIVLETSRLDQGAIAMLRTRVDMLVMFDRDTRLQRLAAGPFKGAAETYMILMALRMIKDVDFRLLFKISGRYVLNSNFNIKKFSLTHATFKKTEKVYSTRLYAVPKDLTSYFARRLWWMYYLSKMGYPIEGLFPKFMDQRKVSLVETLGCQGYISVDGTGIIE